MNSYLFHIYFTEFIFLSNKYLIFGIRCLTLSFADTYGIAKYACTYMRRCTHTRTQKTKVERVGKKGKQKRKKKKRGGNERKKRKEKGQKENSQKREKRRGK